MPSTRCSPWSTCGGSPGLTPGVRAFVFSRAEEGAGEGQPALEEVPLVPISKLSLSSGSRATLAAARESPSAEGLNDVPTPA